MSNLILTLKNFGLSEKEARIYLALLELGTTTIQPVAKKSGVKRTTIYTVLENLKKIGLISEFHKGAKTFITAEDPNYIYKIINEKRGKIQLALPELRLLYNTLSTKPKVRFYEGKNGIKQVYQDTLDEGKEILCFVNWYSMVKSMPDFWESYINERVKRNINVRALAEKSKQSEYYKKREKEELRQLRFLPQTALSFNTEINIYGNKVAMLTFVKEFIGIIIESEQITNTWRMVFEIIWNVSKNC